MELIPAISNSGHIPRLTNQSITSPGHSGWPRGGRVTKSETNYRPLQSFCQNFREPLALYFSGVWTTKDNAELGLPVAILLSHGKSPSENLAKSQERHTISIDGETVRALRTVAET